MWHDPYQFCLIGIAMVLSLKPHFSFIFFSSLVSYIFPTFYLILNVFCLLLFSTLFPWIHAKLENSFLVVNRLSCSNFNWILFWANIFWKLFLPKTKNGLYSHRIPFALKFVLQTNFKKFFKRFYFRGSSRNSWSTRKICDERQFIKTYM